MFSSKGILAVLLLVATAAWIAPAQTFIPQAAAYADPCATSAAAKSSVSVAISSSTTTQLVAPSGSTVVYVCAIFASYASGTTPTMQFTTGTGATCATGTPITQTGAMNLQATAGANIAIGAGHTMFKGSAGHGLCLVSTGTTPTYNGFVTYVQQ